MTIKKLLKTDRYINTISLFTASLYILAVFLTADVYFLFLICLGTDQISSHQTLLNKMPPPY